MMMRGGGGVAGEPARGRRRGAVALHAHALQKGALSLTGLMRPLRLALAPAGAAETAYPAAPWDQIGGGVADRIQRRIGRRVRRPRAEAGGFGRRRLVEVGAERLVQQRHLLGDGVAPFETRHVIRTNLRPGQHVGQALAAQVEIVQRRADRRAEPFAHLPHPAPCGVAGACGRRQRGAHDDRTGAEAIKARPIRRASNNPADQPCPRTSSRLAARVLGPCPRSASVPMGRLA